MKRVEVSRKPLSAVEEARRAVGWAGGGGDRGGGGGGGGGV